jgi:hypothetical protein
MITQEEIYEEIGMADGVGVAGEFRSEFLNVLNHTNLGLPDPVSTNTAFGTIRTTYPARQIQFALKLMSDPKGARRAYSGPKILNSVILVSGGCWGWALGRAVPPRGAYRQAP